MKVLSLFIIALVTINNLTLVASENDINKEIRHFLEKKNIKARLIYLTEIPDNYSSSLYSEKNAKYDLAFVKKKLHSREYLSQINPEYDYDGILRGLKPFSYLLTYGESDELQLKKIKSLLKSTSETEISTKMPWNYQGISALPFLGITIQRGLLIMLFENDIPVFAFDVLPYNHLVMPPSLEQYPRLYKLFFNEESKLYLFYSYAYIPNAQIKSLSNALWEKLAPQANILSYEYAKSQAISSVSYIPNTCKKKDLKLYDIDKFVDVYYNSLINQNKFYLDRETKLLTTKVHKSEIENLKEKIATSKIWIDRDQKRLTNAKKKLAQLKKIYIKENSENN